MAEKSENSNGEAPRTEFERSIARAAATDNAASARAPDRTSALVDGHGTSMKKDEAIASDDQLQALASELETLKQSVMKIAQTARAAATDQVDVTIADIEKTLTRNVFASVGIAALIGYLWGRSR